MPARTKAKATPRSKKKPLSPSRVIDLLEGEYGEVAWRPSGDPIAELVLTLLSQNTSDTNSGRAFMRLLAEFPDYESLLDADVKKIEKAIQPGGLAPTKAPRLQAMLREIWSRQGSLDLEFLRDMPLDEAREWLTSLPGVGKKTAACVLMFSLGRPALPVDTHVHRVAKRLGLVPENSTPDQATDLLEEMLELGQVYPLHIQLIKHGRRTCHARNPKCDACPLASGCPVAFTFG